MYLVGVRPFWSWLKNVIPLTFVCAFEYGDWMNCFAYGRTLNTIVGRIPSASKTAKRRI